MQPSLTVKNPHARLFKIDHVISVYRNDREIVWLTFLFDPRLENIRVFDILVQTTEYMNQNNFLKLLLQRKLTLIRENI